MPISPDNTWRGTRQSPAAPRAADFVCKHPAPPICWRGAGPARLINWLWRDVDVSTGNIGLMAFGRFRLDPQRRVLSHDGAIVKLTPKAFDMLAYLVANSGRLVEKDELLAAVWGQRIVEEGNLSQTIFSVRKALQREPGADRWIVTAPGRGYRFTAHVLSHASDCPPSPRAAGHPSPDLTARPAYSAPGKRPTTAASAAAVAIALTLAGAAAWKLLRHAAPQSSELAAFSPPPHSLAVLAFENLTGDPSDTYLSDGLAEELTDRLARLPGLQLAARRSAFSFEGSKAKIDAVARALNVGAVLDGTVRRVGAHIRVSVQLTDAVSGYQLWTETFEQTPADSLSVETSLASAVVRALKLTLHGGDDGLLTLGGTLNPAAMDAYLHAHAIRTLPNSEANIRAALAAYEKAIALDPGFAMAHLGRSEMLDNLAGRQAGPDQGWADRAMAQSEAETRKAIELAPNLGEAHARLAGLLAETHLDLAGALIEAERARMLAPGDASSLMQIGFVEAAAGHVQDAVTTASRAAALDPLTPRTYRWYAATLIKARDFHGAEAALRHAREIEPQETTNDRYLACEIAYALGHPDEALRLAAGIDDWGRLEFEAIAYHALGQDEEANGALAALKAKLGDSGRAEYARIYAQWGRITEALAELSQAAKSREGSLSLIKVDFLLDPLRNTDAFKQIHRELNFPP